MIRRWKITGVLVVLLFVLSACGQFNSDGENGGQHAAPDPVPQPQEERPVYTVDLYFADSDLMHLYKVEREVEADEEDELPLETLRQWIQGPEQQELSGLVPVTVEVKELTITGGLATVNFSEEIMQANVGSTGEMFILDSLALILQQFDAEQVQILVDGDKVETLLGHVNVEEPYSYQENSSYQIKTLD